MRFRWFLPALGCAILATAALAGMNPASPGFPSVVLSGETFDNNHFSSLCVACHTRNPTAYAAVKDNNAWGTHFVYGGPSFVTQNKSPEKKDAWEAGGFSKYGDRVSRRSVTGAQGEVICESCHNIMVNAGRSKLLALDNDTADPSPLCEGCHTRPLLPGHHVLTGEPSYVFNRPMTNADSMFVRNPPLANSEVTYPGSDRINCRSCHKPHHARTMAGARIVKRGMSVSTPQGAVQGTGVTGIERQYDKDPGGVVRLVTDFTPLCDACHRENDN